MKINMAAKAELMRKRIGQAIGAVVLAFAAVASLSGTAQARPGVPSLSYGDSGRGVECVQIAIKRAGMGGASDYVTVDGVWGPRTQDGVIAFQQHYRVTADGIVGPITGQYMWNDLRKSMYYTDCYDYIPTFMT